MSFGETARLTAAEAAQLFKHDLYGDWQQYASSEGFAALSARLELTEHLVLVNALNSIISEYYYLGQNQQQRVLSWLQELTSNLGVAALEDAVNLHQLLVIPCLIMHMTASFCSEVPQIKKFTDQESLFDLLMLCFQHVESRVVGSSRHRFIRPMLLRLMPYLSCCSMTDISDFSTEYNDVAIYSSRGAARSLASLRYMDNEYRDRSTRGCDGRVVLFDSYTGDTQELEGMLANRIFFSKNTAAIVAEFAQTAEQWSDAKKSSMLRVPLRAELVWVFLHHVKVHFPEKYPLVVGPMVFRLLIPQILSEYSLLESLTFNSSDDFLASIMPLIDKHGALSVDELLAKLVAARHSQQGYLCILLAIAVLACSDDYDKLLKLLSGIINDKRLENYWHTPYIANALSYCFDRLMRAPYSIAEEQRNNDVLQLFVDISIELESVKDNVAAAIRAEVLKPGTLLNVYYTKFSVEISLKRRLIEPSAELEPPFMGLMFARFTKNIQDNSVGLQEQFDSFLLDFLIDAIPAATTSNDHHRALCLHQLFLALHSHVCIKLDSTTVLELVCDFYRLYIDVDAAKTARARYKALDAADDDARVTAYLTTFMSDLQSAEQVPVQAGSKQKIAKRFIDNLAKLPEILADIDPRDPDKLGNKHLITALAAVFFPDEDADYTDILNVLYFEILAHCMAACENKKEPMSEEDVIRITYIIGLLPTLLDKARAAVKHSSILRKFNREPNVLPVQQRYNFMVQAGIMPIANIKAAITGNIFLAPNDRVMNEVTDVMHLQLARAITSFFECDFNFYLADESQPLPRDVLLLIELFLSGWKRQGQESFIFGRMSPVIIQNLNFFLYKLRGCAEGTFKHRLYLKWDRYLSLHAYSMDGPCGWSEYGPQFVEVLKLYAHGTDRQAVYIASLSLDSVRALELWRHSRNDTAFAIANPALLVGDEEAKAVTSEASVIVDRINATTAKIFKEIVANVELSSRQRIEFLIWIRNAVVDDYNTPQLKTGAQIWLTAIWRGINATDYDAETAGPYYVLAVAFAFASLDDDVIIDGLVASKVKAMLVNKAAKIVWQQAEKLADAADVSDENLLLMTIENFCMLFSLQIGAATIQDIQKFIMLLNKLVAKAAKISESFYRSVSISIYSQMTTKLGPPFGSDGQQQVGVLGYALMTESVVSLHDFMGFAPVNTFNIESVSLGCWVDFYLIVHYLLKNNKYKDEYSRSAESLHSYHLLNRFISIKIGCEKSREAITKPALAEALAQLFSDYTLDTALPDFITLLKRVVHYIEDKFNDIALQDITKSRCMAELVADIDFANVQALLVTAVFAIILTARTSAVTKASLDYLPEFYTSKAWQLICGNPIVVSALQSIEECFSEQALNAIGVVEGEARLPLDLFLLKTLCRVSQQPPAVLLKLLGYIQEKSPRLQYLLLLIGKEERSSYVQKLFRHLDAVEQASLKLLYEEHVSTSLHNIRPVPEYKDFITAEINFKFTNYLDLKSLARENHGSFFFEEDEVLRELQAADDSIARIAILRGLEVIPFLTNSNNRKELIDFWDELSTLEVIICLNRMLSQWQLVTTDSDYNYYIAVANNLIAIATAYLLQRLIDEPTNCFAENPELVVEIQKYWSSVNYYSEHVTEQSFAIVGIGPFKPRLANGAEQLYCREVLKNADTVLPGILSELSAEFLMKIQLLHAALNQGVDICEKLLSSTAFALNSMSLLELSIIVWEVFAYILTENPQRYSGDLLINILRRHILRDSQFIAELPAFYARYQGNLPGIFFPKKNALLTVDVNGILGGVGFELEFALLKALLANPAMVSLLKQDAVPGGFVDTCFVMLMRIIKIIVNSAIKITEHFKDEETDLLDTFIELIAYIPLPLFDRQILEKFKQKVTSERQAQQVVGETEQASRSTSDSAEADQSIAVVIPEFTPEQCVVELARYFADPALFPLLNIERSINILKKLYYASSSIYAFHAAFSQFVLAQLANQTTREKFIIWFKRLVDFFNARKSDMDSYKFPGDDVLATSSEMDNAAALILLVLVSGYVTMSLQPNHMQHFSKKDDRAIQKVVFDCLANHPQAFLIFVNFAATPYKIKQRKNIRAYGVALFVVAEEVACDVMLSLSNLTAENLLKVLRNITEKSLANESVPLSFLMYIYQKEYNLAYIIDATRRAYVNEINALLNKLITTKIRVLLASAKDDEAFIFQMLLDLCGSYEALKFFIDEAGKQPKLQEKLSQAILSAIQYLEEFASRYLLKVLPESNPTAKYCRAARVILRNMYVYNMICEVVYLEKNIGSRELLKEVEAAQGGALTNAERVELYQYALKILAEKLNDKYPSATYSIKVVNRVSDLLISITNLVDFAASAQVEYLPDLFAQLNAQPLIDVTTVRNFVDQATEQSYLAAELTTILMRPLCNYIDRFLQFGNLHGIMFQLNDRSDTSKLYQIFSLFLTIIVSKDAVYKAVREKYEALFSRDALMLLNLARCILFHTNTSTQSRQDLRMFICNMRRLTMIGAETFQVLEPIEASLQEETCNFSAAVFKYTAVEAVANFKQRVEFVSSEAGSLKLAHDHFANIQNHQQMRYIDLLIATVNQYRDQPALFQRALKLLISFLDLDDSESLLIKIFNVKMVCALFLDMKAVQISTDKPGVIKATLLETITFLLKNMLYVSFTRNKFEFCHSILPVLFSINLVEAGLIIRCVTQSAINGEEQLEYHGHVFSNVQHFKKLFISVLQQYKVEKPKTANELMVALCAAYYKKDMVSFQGLLLVGKQLLIESEVVHVNFLAWCLDAASNEHHWTHRVDVGDELDVKINVGDYCSQSRAILEAVWQQKIMHVLAAGTLNEKSLSDFIEATLAFPEILRWGLAQVIEKHGLISTILVQTIIRELEQKYRTNTVDYLKPQYEELLRQLTKSAVLHYLRYFPSRLAIEKGASINAKGKEPVPDELVAAVDPFFSAMLFFLLSAGSPLLLDDDLRAAQFISQQEQVVSAEGSELPATVINYHYARLRLYESHLTETKGESEEKDALEYAKETYLNTAKFNDFLKILRLQILDNPTQLDIAALFNASNFYLTSISDTQRVIIYFEILTGFISVAASTIYKETQQNGYDVFAHLDTISEYLCLTGSDAAKARESAAGDVAHAGVVDVRNVIPILPQQLVRMSKFLPFQHSQNVAMAIVNGMATKMVDQVTEYLFGYSSCKLIKILAIADKDGAEYVAAVGMLGDFLKLCADIIEQSSLFAAKQMLLSVLANHSVLRNLIRLHFFLREHAVGMDISTDAVKGIFVTLQKIFGEKKTYKEFEDRVDGVLTELEQPSTAATDDQAEALITRLEYTENTIDDILLELEHGLANFTEEELTTEWAKKLFAAVSLVDIADFHKRLVSYIQQYMQNSQRRQIIVGWLTKLVDKLITEQTGKVYFDLSSASMAITIIKLASALSIDSEKWHVMLTGVGTLLANRVGRLLSSMASLSLAAQAHGPSVSESDDSYIKIRGEYAELMDAAYMIHAIESAHSYATGFFLTSFKELGHGSSLPESLSFAQKLFADLPNRETKDAGITQGSLKFINDNLIALSRDEKLHLEDLLAIYFYWLQSGSQFQDVMRRTLRELISKRIVGVYKVSEVQAELMIDYITPPQNINLQTHLDNLFDVPINTLADKFPDSLFWLAILMVSQARHELGDKLSYMYKSFAEYLHHDEFIQLFALDSLGFLNLDRVLTVMLRNKIYDNQDLDATIIPIIIKLLHFAFVSDIECLSRLVKVLTDADSFLNTYFIKLIAICRRGLLASYVTESIIPGHVEPAKATANLNAFLSLFTDDGQLQVEASHAVDAEQLTARPGTLAAYIALMHANHPELLADCFPKMSLHHDYAATSITERYWMRHLQFGDKKDVFKKQYISFSPEKAFERKIQLLHSAFLMLSLDDALALLNSDVFSLQTMTYIELSIISLELWAFILHVDTIRGNNKNSNVQYLKASDVSAVQSLISKIVVILCEGAFIAAKGTRRIGLLEMGQHPYGFLVPAEMLDSETTYRIRSGAPAAWSGILEICAQYHSQQHSIYLQVLLTTYIPLTDPIRNGNRFSIGNAAIKDIILSAFSSKDTMISLKLLLLDNPSYIRNLCRYMLSLCYTYVVPNHVRTMFVKFLRETMRDNPCVDVSSKRDLVRATNMICILTQGSSSFLDSEERSFCRQFCTASVDEYIHMLRRSLDDSSTRMDFSAENLLKIIKNISHLPVARNAFSALMNGLFVLIYEIRDDQAKLNILREWTRDLWRFMSVHPAVDSDAVQPAEFSDYQLYYYCAVVNYLDYFLSAQHIVRQDINYVSIDLPYRSFMPLAIDFCKTMRPFESKENDKRQQRHIVRYLLPDIMCTLSLAGLVEMMAGLEDASADETQWYHSVVTHRDFTAPRRNFNRQFASEQTLVSRNDLLLKLFICAQQQDIEALDNLLAKFKNYLSVSKLNIVSLLAYIYTLVSKQLSQDNGSNDKLCNHLIRCNAYLSYIIFQRIETILESSSKDTANLRVALFRIIGSIILCEELMYQFISLLQRNEHYKEYCLPLLEEILRSFHFSYSRHEELQKYAENVNSIITKLPRWLNAASSDKNSYDPFVSRNNIEPLLEELKGSKYSQMFQWQVSSVFSHLSLSIMRLFPKLPDLQSIEKPLSAKQQVRAATYYQLFIFLQSLRQVLLHNLKLRTTADVIKALITEILNISILEGMIAISEIKTIADQLGLMLNYNVLIDDKPESTGKLYTDTTLAFIEQMNGLLVKEDGELDEMLADDEFTWLLSVEVFAELPVQEQQIILYEIFLNLRELNISELLFTQLNNLFIALVETIRNHDLASIQLLGLPVNGYKSLLGNLFFVHGLDVVAEQVVSMAMAGVNTNRELQFILDCATYSNRQFEFGYRALLDNFNEVNGENVGKVNLLNSSQNTLDVWNIISYILKGVALAMQLTPIIPKAKNNVNLTCEVFMFQELLLDKSTVMFITSHFVYFIIANDYSTEHLIEPFAQFLEYAFNKGLINFKRKELVEGLLLRLQSNSLDEKDDELIVKILTSSCHLEEAAAKEIVERMKPAEPEQQAMLCKEIVERMKPAEPEQQAMLCDERGDESGDDSDDDEDRLFMRQDSDEEEVSGSMLKSIGGAFWSGFNAFQDSFGRALRGGAGPSPKRPSSVELAALIRGEKPAQNVADFPDSDARRAEIVNAARENHERAAQDFFRL